ncbi:MAG TPA: magnesium chelatase, partial [Chloroflexia bacterium]|nr:magnesium chelatase [Chloroflexia bacterium]
MEYVHQASDLKGIRAALAKLEVGSNPSTIAAAVEFILEGLHLNRRLNKDRTAEGTRYRR